MLREISRFLDNGGPFLMIAFALFVIAGLMLTVLCVAGLIAYLRQPRGSAPKPSRGVIVATILLCTIPGVLAVTAALLGRAEMLAIVPTAPPDQRTQIVTWGITRVLNPSFFVAITLVLLAPLAAMTIAIWGPIRQRYIDLCHARALEREETP